MLREIDPRWGVTAVVAFGWVWGSFINQTIDRAPPRRGTSVDAPPWGLTLLSPTRSLCLTCGRPIAWFDNLPVFSYLWLRGCCRHCGAAIGFRTLVVESLMPAAFALLFWLEVGGWAPPLLFPWSYLLLSWAVGAAGRLTERRRGGPWFWVSGVLCGLAMGAQAMF